MTDHVNFPDIFVNPSLPSSGIGSLADPYNNTGDVNWAGGGDNCVADYYSGSPSQSATVNIMRDQRQRGHASIGTPGTWLYPIIFRGYGTGANPIVDPSVDISTSAYKWTLSQAGANEYYLEAAAGGSPGLGDAPKHLFLNDVRCGFGTAEVIGLLSDHAFEWGHNAADEAAPNSKGVFDTVYLRDDSGNPDTTGAVVDAPQKNYAFYLDEDWVVAEGVDFQYSNGHGVRVADGASYDVIRECVSHSHWWAALQVYNSSTDCEFNGCDVYNCIGANININGGPETPVLRLLITGCDIHDAAVNYGAFTEASGIKAFRLNESLITKNRWYNNLSGAIRFDGLSGEFGCDSNVVSKNELWNNGGIPDGLGGDPKLYPQLEFEFSKLNTIKHNHFHDPWGGGPNIAMSHGGTDNNIITANIVCGSYANYYMGSITNQTFAGDEAGKENSFLNNILYGNYRGFTISSGHTTILRNNIVAGSLGFDLQVNEGYTDIDSDYNCFSSDGIACTRETGVWTNRTLAQWQALPAGNDAHSIDGDSLMVDPGNGDFELTSASPCIDIGVDLGSPHNELLMPGSEWVDNVETGDPEDY